MAPIPPRWMPQFIAREFHIAAVRALMLIQIDRDAVDADDAGRFCNVHAAFLAVAAGPALADCGGNHEASEDTKKEKSSGV